jgi:hypothetical protein
LWQLPPLAPPITDLLRSCLAHDPNQRPAPGRLAAEVSALAEAVVGPSLRRWCQDHAWQARRTRAATLEGQVLVEAPLVLDDAPVWNGRTHPPRVVARPPGTIDPGAVPPPPVRRPAQPGPPPGLVAASVAAGCFVAGLVGSAVLLVASLVGLALFATHA